MFLKLSILERTQGRSLEISVILVVSGYPKEVDQAMASDKPNQIEIFDESGNLVAVYFDFNQNDSNVDFLTKTESELQLAVMNKKVGERIKPHYHPPFSRRLNSTQEVLLILRGKIRADLYNSSDEIFRRVILTEGTGLQLVSGGHGFEILEPCKFIEIKQGPYAGEKDKIFILGDSKN